MEGTKVSTMGSSVLRLSVPCSGTLGACSSASLQLPHPLWSLSMMSAVPKTHEEAEKGTIITCSGKGGNMGKMHTAYAHRSKSTQTRATTSVTAQNGRWACRAQRCTLEVELRASGEEAFGAARLVLAHVARPVGVRLALGAAKQRLLLAEAVVDQRQQRHLRSSATNERAKPRLMLAGFNFADDRSAQLIMLCTKVKVCMLAIVHADRTSSQLRR